MPIKITINHGDGWSETWEVDDNNELFVEDHKRNYRRPCGPYGVDACSAIPLVRRIAELEALLKDRN